MDPYNPLDLEALGDSLLRAIEARPPEALSEIRSFAGSGVYALYYVGTAEPYKALGAFNREHDPMVPIYFGRAAQPGARRGLSPFEAVTSPLLFKRVREHRNSIASAESAKSVRYHLRVQDFLVRTLVCLPIWTPLAEAMAIRRYQPLWNSHLAGFGIHSPGSGRAGQQRSAWDELHSGREFARGRDAHARSAAALANRMQSECAAIVARELARRQA